MLGGSAGQARLASQAVAAAMIDGRGSNRGKKGTRGSSSVKGGALSSTPVRHRSAATMRCLRGMLGGR